MVFYDVILKMVLDILGVVVMYLTCCVTCIIPVAGACITHNVKLQRLQEQLNKMIINADKIKFKLMKTQHPNRQNCNDENLNDENSSIQLRTVSVIMDKYINMTDMRTGHPRHEDILNAKTQINGFLDALVSELNEYKMCNSWCSVFSLENKFISKAKMEQIASQLVYISSIVEPLNWIWHQIDTHVKQQSQIEITREKRHKLIEKLMTRDNDTYHVTFYEYFLNSVLTNNNKYRYVLADLALDASDSKKKIKLKEGIPSFLCERVGTLG